MIAAIDGYQRRHGWLGFPLGVVYKFFDDQGGYLAALITYYAFLSIFPLLLLASSVLGFVLQDNPELRADILESAVAQFPVIGSELTTTQGLTGSTAAIVIGLLGALYGALGIAQATQHAMNVAWSVPRNRRPNPLFSRLRSLLLLAIAGLSVLSITLLSLLAAELGWLGAEQSVWSRMLVTVLTVAISAVVFSLLFWLATTDAHDIRDVVPGAVIAALLLHGMQLVGAAYVGTVVRNTSLTYGVFAVVLGLLAWIYICAILMVMCIELNVVVERQLYPRALLTPFTDDVDLTDADRRAYTAYANAQRTKGFETVHVSFDAGKRRRGHIGKHSHGH
ncbi:MAG TPA: YihY/virulence factor BrkB family protein [Nocardioidaceae bacterium]|nr:YihY/virulence factor BrkB family protein [Nocardioidaceae bacterium]